MQRTSWNPKIIIVVMLIITLIMSSQLSLAEFYLTKGDVPHLVIVAQYQHFSPEKVTKFDCCRYLPTKLFYFSTCIIRQKLSHTDVKSLVKCLFVHPRAGNSPPKAEWETSPLSQADATLLQRATNMDQRKCR